MTKSTPDLKPGDRLVLPRTKGDPEVVTVLGSYHWQPGPRDMIAHSTGSETMVIVQHAPSRWRRKGRIEEIGAKATKVWLLA